MSEDATKVEREIVVAREQVVHANAAIRERASDALATVRRRTDLGRLAGEYPWAAIGIAVGLGALVAAIRAEEKAARAAVRGARAAADATVGGAKSVRTKVKERFGGESGAEGLEDEAKRMDDADLPQRDASGHSFGDRVFAVAAIPFRSGFDRLLGDMRMASTEWMGSLSKRGQVGRTLSQPIAGSNAAVADSRDAAWSVDRVDRRPMKPIAPPAPLAGSDVLDEEDAVPVPREMMPTELDARADAVEAVGGGTHEPPLVPGAGDLGARWA